MEKSKVVGVVLDISLRHADNGKRIVDIVKSHLREYVRSCFEEEDLFYLYHPEVVEVLERKGEQVGAIANYESDGYRFDLWTALKQTLYVCGSQDPDLDKYVILITDRITDKQCGFIEKMSVLNKKDDLGCSFVLIGIGDKYHQNNHFRHIDDSSDLLNLLQEVK